MAPESLTSRAGGRVPWDDIRKHLSQQVLDTYQFFSLFESSVPNKCTPEGYKWVAWPFPGKQGQLLSFAQALSGKQLVGLPQPACAGNPPALMRSPFLCEACAPEHHHKVVLWQPRKLQASAGLGVGGGWASWNAIQVRGGGSALLRGELTTPLSTHCSLRS